MLQSWEEESYTNLKLPSTSTKRYHHPSRQAATPEKKSGLHYENSRSMVNPNDFWNDNHNVAYFVHGMDHATRYVQRVQRRFMDMNQPERYDQFIEILHRYRMGHLSIPHVVENMSDLFSEQHSDLFQEFLQFVPPPEYIVRLTPHQNHSTTTDRADQIDDNPVDAMHDPRILNEYIGNIDRSIRFVQRVQERFVNDPDMYEIFLETLYWYQTGRFGVEQVNELIPYIFSQHPDLLQEFQQL